MNFANNWFGRCSMALCAVAVLMFVSCDNAPKFKVVGTISNAVDSMLYFDAITVDGVVAIDSARLDDGGDFEFEGDKPASPEFYVLRLGNHFIDFSADSTETIRFVADRESMDTAYVVEGSESSVKIKELMLMRKELERKIIAVEKNKSMYPGDITDSINAMVRAYKDMTNKEYIHKDPASAYAYYALMQTVTDLTSRYVLFNPYADRNDAKSYASVATSWGVFYPSALRTIKLCDIANKAMQHTAPKTEKILELDESKVHETGIIDIQLPDVNSELRSIKELKGKVVLLDFTMYSAPESSKRTMSLRELYEKYKEQGFEIYQVSLDQDTHFWKYSVQKLPWICVHETDGRATTTYGVSTLPTFFLVSRQNEVVVRSEFMEGSLESNIQALLK